MGLNSTRQSEKRPYLGEDGRVHLVCPAGHVDPHATAAAAVAADGDEGAEGGGEAGQPDGEVLGTEDEGGRRRGAEIIDSNFYFFFTICAIDDS